MAFDLAHHRQRAIEHVLPAYQQLGRIAFIYLQGSLVAGYTDRSDLDLILVWDQDDIPAPREGVVSALDEARRAPPSVVDYRDVHLDRFTQDGQEYNAGHWRRTDFAATVRNVLAGDALEGNGILRPLVTVSGFCSADLIYDPDGRAKELREALRAFPATLAPTTRRRARGHRSTSLTAAETFAARADWLMFESTLAEATRIALHAMFAAQAVYYPGDKWLRQAIVHFDLGTSVMQAFDQVWDPAAPAAERIAGLRRLLDLAAAAGSP